MIIALFPNEKKKHSFELAIQIREFLEARGIAVAAEDEKAAAIGSMPLSSVDPNDIGFLISMGGDGTLLRISHQYSHLDAPILGINLGHLGFMADIPTADIFASLTDLLNSAYTVDKRLALEATASRANPYGPSTISSFTAPITTASSNLRSKLTGSTSTPSSPMGSSSPLQPDPPPILLRQEAQS